MPETPSPDVLTVNKPAAAGRNVDDLSPGKGRVAKAQRTQALAGPPATGTFATVCKDASQLYARIRRAVCQAAPSTLKTAFLEPVNSQLPADLSVALFARTDPDFMALFTGGWVGCGGCGGGGCAECACAWGRGVAACADARTLTPPPTPRPPACSGWRAAGAAGQP